MAGQAHHFLKYATAMDPPHDQPYAKDRYRTKMMQLYSVLD
jgi:GSH-dependent disulfide-bond oxidoreductase